jgi:hypothetical protein
MSVSACIRCSPACRRAVCMSVSGLHSVLTDMQMGPLHVDIGLYLVSTDMQTGCLHVDIGLHSVLTSMQTSCLHVGIGLAVGTHRHADGLFACRYQACIRCPPACRWAVLFQIIFCLFGKHLIITALLLHQLLMCPAFCNTPIGHYNNSIHIPYRRKSVSYNNSRCLLTSI